MEVNMIVRRTSPFSGEVNEVDLDVTEGQLRDWEAGGLIQEVFPHLTDDEREFIMTGITPEEWKEAFGEDDEPEEDLYNPPNPCWGYNRVVRRLRDADRI
jgi:hypothetical protein